MTVPAPIQTCTVRQLLPLLQALHQADPAAAPVLLDVREAWELQTARLDIPGTRTVHIPMGELPGRLSELDPSQPVLGLCHHGVRSLQCVSFLRRQGFASLYNIEGGIHAWSSEVDGTVPQY